jgi:cold shock CspA family protein
MLLGWDYEYTDEDSNTFVTKTSFDLITEVTYPVAMHQVIDDNAEDDLVRKLFVPRNPDKKVFSKQPFAQLEVDDENFNVYNTDNDRKESTIKSLKEGYGFINFPPNNVFFHYTSLIDYDFNDLAVGDRVQFDVETKEGGRLVAHNITVLEQV